MRPYTNGKPVFGLDVDGTLAEYHSFFRWFAMMYSGKDLNGEPYDGSVPFATHLGLSRPKYREIKLAFRQSGLKRAMPANPNAAMLTRWLRRAGAEIVICTTRPYLHLSNIEPDLREWLRRNGIKYDDIIMGEHKYRELRRGYGDRVQAVLDDLPEMVLQANQCGFFAFLIDRSWNRPPVFEGKDWKGLRVHSLEEAEAEMEEFLR